MFIFGCNPTVLLRPYLRHRYSGLSMPGQCHRRAAVVTYGADNVTFHVNEFGTSYPIPQLLGNRGVDIRCQGANGSFTMSVVILTIVFATPKCLTQRLYPFAEADHYTMCRAYSPIRTPSKERSDEFAPIIALIIQSSPAIQRGKLHDPKVQ